MDNVTKELKTNNMKLKGLVESVSPCYAKQCWQLPATKLFKLVVPVQMRSRRNFCIDITLICILLALGLYLYMMFKNK